MTPAPMRAMNGAVYRRRHLRSVLFGFLCAGLAGCATTGSIQLVHLQVDAPLKVLIAQTPMNIDRARLVPVLAPKLDAKSPAADKAIAQGVAHAEAYALKAMQAALRAQSGRVAVVAPAPETKSLIGEIARKGFSAGIAQR